MRQYRDELNHRLLKNGHDVNVRFPDGYQEAPLAYDAVWAVALGRVLKLFNSKYVYLCRHENFMFHFTFFSLFPLFVCTAGTQLTCMIVKQVLISFNVYLKRFEGNADFSVYLALNRTMNRLAEQGRSLEEFTYSDAMIAGEIYSAMNATQFLGVSVSLLKYNVCHNLIDEIWCREQ